ncbi:hypothetical protein [Pseudomonas izuensis]|uniref:hypothetical protein n=1 Tax=Pseudomonas izuensis TaxID=2684212 RepID=UPI00135A05CC|nr:hypothetical protein [Pseudomonas izuensis]
MALSNPPTDKNSKKRSLVHSGMCSEVVEELAMVVAERLMAPQRVKVSLDELDDIDEVKIQE